MINWEQVLQWKKAYARELVVIKFGGALAEDRHVTNHIAEQVCFLRSSLNLNIVVVHGGGNQIDAALQQNGLTVTKDKTTGLRITDEPTICVTDHSLRALNGDITNTFLSASKEVLAVGMAGYDGRTITAQAYGPELGGYTGHSPNVNKAYFDMIFAQHGTPYLPVIYPICHSGDPQKHERRLNVNADDVAAALATQLGATRLLLCSNIPGVLDDKQQLIQRIDINEVSALVNNKVVTGGMIKKVLSAAKAASEMTRGGVVILDGRKQYAILDELLTNQGSGTLFIKQSAVTSPHPG